MKFLVIVALFGLVAVALAGRKINKDLDEDWAAYKTKYEKEYKNAHEDSHRRAIWETNLRIIQRHNMRFDMGEETFTMGMNKFGDMTSREFTAIMNGYQQVETRNPTKTAPSTGDNPPSVDWRKKGYVTGVKDQGQCGSCWAFSSTGSLEGQWFKKTGKLVSLSEQNLVDCSFGQGNLGCLGGLMDRAFTYVHEMGIESESDYPYKGTFEFCAFDINKSVLKDTGFVDIPKGDELALQTNVANIGPISIAIDASQNSFQLYKSGVYNEPKCSNSTLDHGVLLVGYDTDPTGGPYYIVKNSWGADWGQQGYIWMSRNKSNQCGIATQASYPLV